MGFNEDLNQRKILELEEENKSMKKEIRKLRSILSEVEYLVGKNPVNYHAFEEAIKGWDE